MTIVNQGLSPADLVELVVVALLLLGVLIWHPWLAPLARRFETRTGWVMVFLAALPVVLRLALLPHHPAPAPDLYDEFSHLLAADTLRHFRLANPPHALPQFFETFFVLQRPTYASIYPPGQGLALAIGWTLFGHPWAGVLAATAAFCGLCYWMLRGWVSPRWALVGGLLAVIEFGPLNQWMNEYWGGEWIAASGCLVFGALPRLRAAPRRRDALLLGLGLAMLSASATVIGLAAADGAMHLLTRLIPADTLAGMPYLQGLGLTPRVLGFTLAISFLSVVIFSLTPIVSMSREEMRAGLTEGSRTASGTVWHKFGSNLVVVELATAVVLLVGAGLLGKSLYRLLQVDPGLQPNNLAILPLSIARESYPRDPQVLALERQILDRITALPGVTSAAITNKLPVGDGDFTTSFRVVGRPYHSEHNEVAYRIVSTDYFKTLQSRLVEGRYFTAAEDSTKPLVALINRALARKYFPGEQPVGML